MPEFARIAVGELQTFTRNPRRGDVDAIAESLSKHGQYRTIVVNAGTLTGRRNEVLAGNHTLLAARQLGWDAVDATVVDVDDQTATSIVLADNRLADLGEYDSTDLHALLAGLDDLGGTGYDLADLAALERELFPPVPHTDPDDVPDLPAVVVSQVGQVWQLGDHRLIVGDCTDVEVLRRLCGDVAPDCVWTDPPYGVDYVGKTKDALRIRNDQSAQLANLLDAAFTAAVAVAAPGAPVYVWVKNTMVLGRSDFHYRHEPILYGFTPGGSGRRGRGGSHWQGDNSQTTVFEFDKPPRSTEHPTMKPVALIDAMLANSLPPGGVVLDPFAGSGSTLIAAHGRSSRAFCVELDPAYADVILRRFEAHTGVVPLLDGEPVSFLEAA